MKLKIHPNYRPSTIECACGHVVETYSTKGSYRVDICAACHPFYTGKQKLVDSAGRIERFNRKYGRTTAAAAPTAAAAATATAATATAAPTAAAAPTTTAEGES